MQWYYGIGNEVGGPVENDGLLGLVRAGEVKAETLVWASYLGNWTPAGKIDGLFAAAGSPPTGETTAAVSQSAPAPAVPELAMAGAGGMQTEAPAVKVNSGAGQEPVPVQQSPVPVKGESTWKKIEPRVETGQLGLTEAPPQGTSGELNTAGVPLNPVEHGETAAENPVQEIPEPGPAPSPKPLEETFRTAPATGAGARAEEGGGLDFSSERSGGTSVKKAGWKKWALPAAAALVLLVGGAALADKFLLRGALFGFGASPTGPNRYFPDGPKIAIRIEVREVLLSPFVAGNVEVAEAMGMVDQMMQSAVGLRPYDILDVKVVGTDVGTSSPRFVCIVTTTKKIPEDLVVEKLFGETSGKNVGGRDVYELPMSQGLSACVADENTFLIGGRREIEQVLYRTEEPVFSEEELLILNAVTESETVFSMGADKEMMGAFGEEGGDGPAVFFSDEEMESARVVTATADFGEKFEIGYRANFESEEAARTVFERLSVEAGIRGGEGDAFEVERADVIQEFAQGALPEGFDPQAFRGMVGKQACHLSGNSVAIRIEVPMGFFDKLISQGMGAATGGGGF